MSTQIHTISTFICLHCCERHRAEIGLPAELATHLEPCTLEELIDLYPEVPEIMETDDFQYWVFQQFLNEHAQHDVRFIPTFVEQMNRIVAYRTQHYQQVIDTYERYRDVLRETNKMWSPDSSSLVVTPIPKLHTRPRPSFGTRKKNLGARDLFQD